MVHCQLHQSWPGHLAFPKGGPAFYVQSYDAWRPHVGRNPVHHLAHGASVANFNVSLVEVENEAFGRQRTAVAAAPPCVAGTTASAAAVSPSSPSYPSAPALASCVNVTRTPGHGVLRSPPSMLEAAASAACTTAGRRKEAADAMGHAPARARTEPTPGSRWR